MKLQKSVKYFLKNSCSPTESLHTAWPRTSTFLYQDRRKISVDTSLRLGKYFGVSEKYFLDMQNDIDLRNEKSRIAAELEAIPLAVKSDQ